MSEAMRLLELEAEELESSLRADIRSIKLQRIRAVLDVYAPNAEMPVLVTETAARSKHKGMPAEGTKARLVFEAIDIMLEDRSMRRTEILDKLVEAGLMGHEKRPLNSLAGYLTDYREFFVSNGKGLYRLSPKKKALA